MARSVFLLVLLMGGGAFGLPAEHSGEVSSKPLSAVASIESGEPLFERMDAERTGVDFVNRYDHPDKWGDLWRQYFNGSIGAGVCLGDVDGDGRADLFAVGKDSPNALYRNEGDFRFEDVTDHAGVAGAGGMGAGAAMVDVDNDGDLDLYVTYVGSTNELYLNDGHGVFTEKAAEWGLDFNTGSNAPSFGDYDRDGDLDLYLQKNFLAASGIPGGLPDQLYRNDGDWFADVTEQAGIRGEGQGHVAVWWDYNEDGWPDIYIANDFEAADKLYRNNRDGTFADVVAEALVAVPYSSMGADVGDINNDGHIDLLAAEMKPRSLAYFQRTVGPLAGKLMSVRESGVNQYMQNMLSVRIAPGQYAEMAAYAGLEATDWTWSPRLLDLDNDGQLDAFFTNGMVRAFHDADLAARVGKARSLMQKVAIFERSPPLLESNLAYRNVGDARFEERSAEWGLDEVGVSFAAAAGDLDGDGDLDLVVGNWDGPLSLYRNRSVDGNRAVIRLVGEVSNRFGVGARVVAEGGGLLQARELSLMRGYMSVDAPELHFAFDGTERIEKLRILWPSGREQTLKNLALGHRYTIRESSRASVEETKPEAATRFQPAPIGVDRASVSEEEYFQAFKGQALLPFVEDRLGPPMAVADFDGDGWKDVALGGATGQPLRVFRNERGQRLRWVESEAFEDDFDSEDAALIAADFDADGDLDLFASSGGIELDAEDRYYANRLYRNVGDMRFEPWPSPQLAANRQPSGAAVAVDIAGDGALELAVAGGSLRRDFPRSAQGHVWSVGPDGFAASESAFFEERRKTTSLARADVDGDGDWDVLETAAWSPPRVWLNEEGRLALMDLGLAEEALLGYWRSAAAADFDGDGRQDLVFGNLGLNTKYRASAESPVVLLSLHEEGEPSRLVEAISEKGELFPTESRLFHQMYFPELMAATGSYENFASMSVDDIFPKEMLDRFERRALTEHRTLLLLAQEEGGFKAAPLPDLAQAGVAVAMLAADVDADGDTDLLMAHESHSPLPSAAVLPERSYLTLLLNQGGAGFEAALPGQSGLAIERGQPRALAWEDLDGDGAGELLVATNGGPLYVFKWSGGSK